MKKSLHLRHNQNKTLVWFFIGLSSLIVGGGYFYYSQQNPARALTSNSNLNGERIFAKNCLVCHGPEAIGEDPSQPRGGIKANREYLAPALNGKGHTWHHANEELLNIIKNGSIADDSPMKGFKDRLSDQEIVAVLDYIKSLWPEEIQKRHSMRPE